MKNLRIKKTRQGLLKQYDVFRDYTNDELSNMTLSEKNEKRQKGMKVGSFGREDQAKIFVKENGGEQIDYFTDTRVKINDRISKGLTLFFETEKAAEEVAREMRSYVYDVFTYKRGKFSLIGFGVPK